MSRQIIFKSASALELVINEEQKRKRERRKLYMLSGFSLRK